MRREPHCKGEFLMGVDIHIKVTMFDKITEKYKEVNLYNEDNNRIDIFPYRSYVLFDILNGNDDEINLPSSEISFSTLESSLAGELKAWKNEDGCYGFSEVTLADIIIETLKHPVIKNWDNEDIESEPNKPNPLIAFVERIKYFLDFANVGYSDYLPPSKIKIIYWFDR